MKTSNRRSKTKNGTQEQLGIRNRLRYKNGTGEMILDRLDFLRRLNDDEEKRLSIIESKTSQLFSQTGVIVAILSFSVPLILEKTSSVPWRVVLFASLLFAGFYYLRTIYLTGKNLDIRKFQYARSSIANVVDEDLASRESFLIEEINDFLYSLPVNTKINNEKGTNLIAATRSFFIANILVGIFALLLCAVLLPYQKDDLTKISIDGVVKTASTSIGETRSEDSSEVPSNSQPDKGVVPALEGREKSTEGNQNSATP